MDIMKFLTRVGNELTALKVDCFWRENTTAELVKQAEKLEEEVKNLVDYLDDMAMEEAKNSIPPIDKYFEDNPVTDFVDASIKYLQGIEQDKQKENIKKAANKINKNKDSTEYFVEKIVNDLEFSEEQRDYKEEFKKHLIEAINNANTASLMANFLVLVGKDYIRGKVRTGDGDIIVSIGDKEYKREKKEEYKEEKCSCDVCSCNAYDGGEVFADDEYYGEDCYYGYCHDDDDDECEDVYDNTKEGYSKEDLVKYIEDLDEQYYNKVHNVALKNIEETLSKQKEFTTEDVELMRYYLKHQPYNEEDVDSLKDSTVILAWKLKQQEKENK